MTDNKENKSGCCGGNGEHKHDHDHECCGGNGHHKHDHDHECCGGNGHHKHDHDHECCGGNGHEDVEMRMMKVELEDGTKEEFGVVDIFEVEGFDKEYIALVTQDGEQVYLYEYVKGENDEISLENIEDDDEFDKVAEAFEANIEED